MEKRKQQVLIFSAISVLLFVLSSFVMISAILYGTPAYTFPFLFVATILFAVAALGTVSQKKWSLHVGFITIFIGMIGILLWQKTFKTIIKALTFSEAALNTLAILNVVVVFSLFLVLCYSLFLQIKLRKIRS